MDYQRLPTKNNHRLPWITMKLPRDYTGIIKILPEITDNIVWDYLQFLPHRPRPQVKICIIIYSNGVVFEIKYMSWNVGCVALIASRIIYTISLEIFILKKMIGYYGNVTWTFLKPKNLKNISNVSARSIF